MLPQTASEPKPAKTAAPPSLDAARLAELFLHPRWGLQRATQHPNLRELCQGLGDCFEAQAQGRHPGQGLCGLMPLLLADCAEELRRHRAPRRDQRVLLAARLLWACPALGARGRRVALKAWCCAWGRDPEAKGML